MVLKIAVTAFQFLFVASLAADFPSICPSTQNLPKVCEELKKIPRNKTLVFADGSEMPGCLLQTPSPVEQRLQENLRVLEALLVAAYLKDMPNAKFTQREIGEFVAKIKRPQADGKSSTSMPLGYLQAYESILKALDGYEGYIKVKSPPKKDIEDSIKRVSRFLNTLPEGKTFQGYLQEISSQSQPPEMTISCKSKPNAFFQRANGQSDVSLSRAMWGYPRATQRFVIGHEIGHRMDPCTSNAQSPANPFRHFMMSDAFKRGSAGIKKDNEIPMYPFEKLVNCIRNDVGNFKQTPSNSRPEVEEAFKYHCIETHTREAFCDHVGLALAVEDIKTMKYPVLKKDPNKIYMPKGYEHAFFFIDLACAKNGEPESSSHPAPARRLNDIFLKNPVMAKAMSCQVDPKAPYCDLRKGTINKPNDEKRVETPRAKDTPKK